MAAYGAELINVPAGKMEMARDLALEMQVSNAQFTGQIGYVLRLASGLVSSKTVSLQSRPILRRHFTNIDLLEILMMQNTKSNLHLNMNLILNLISCGQEGQSHFSCRTREKAKC